MYPSHTYAAHKARRLRRIGARATAELREAFAAGELTLRQYDLISRIAPEEQRAKVAALKWEIQASQLAADTIEAILDRMKGEDDLVRLNEVARSIGEAVSDSLQNGKSPRCRDH